ncbi:MAG: ribbon-helix-helix protein, CopG family [Heliomarina sp.]|uniref:ribbon-helix-helix protein, CopG family n=1 Tax=Heliomarina sp. TaxID=2917556 RepID=UPI004059A824
MSKHRITITVDPDIDEWLQASAKIYGRSLSELVRICLREFSQEHPTRFATRDKARTETPEAWRVVWKDVHKS